MATRMIDGAEVPLALLGEAEAPDFDMSDAMAEHIATDVTDVEPHAVHEIDTTPYGRLPLVGPTATDMDNGGSDDEDDSEGEQLPAEVKRARAVRGVTAADARAPATSVSVVRGGGFGTRTTESDDDDYGLTDESEPEPEPKPAKAATKPATRAAAKAVTKAKAEVKATPIATAFAAEEDEAEGDEVELGEAQITELFKDLRRPESSNPQLAAFIARERKALAAQAAPSSKTDSKVDTKPEPKPEPKTKQVVKQRVKFAVPAPAPAPAPAAAPTPVPTSAAIRSKPVDCAACRGKGVLPARGKTPAFCMCAAGEVAAKTFEERAAAQAEAGAQAAAQAATQATKPAKKPKSAPAPLPEDTDDEDAGSMDEEMAELVARIAARKKQQEDKAREATKAAQAKAKARAAKLAALRAQLEELERGGASSEASDEDDDDSGSDTDTDSDFPPPTPALTARERALAERSKAERSALRSSRAHEADEIHKSRADDERERMKAMEDAWRSTLEKEAREKAVKGATKAAKVAKGGSPASARSGGARGGAAVVPSNDVTDAADAPTMFADIDSDDEEADAKRAAAFAAFVAEHGEVELTDYTPEWMSGVKLKDDTHHVNTTIETFAAKNPVLMATMKTTWKRGFDQEEAKRAALAAKASANFNPAVIKDRDAAKEAARAEEFKKTEKARKKRDKLAKAKKAEDMRNDFIAWHRVTVFAELRAKLRKAPAVDAVKRECDTQCNTKSRMAAVWKRYLGAMAERAKAEAAAADGHAVDSLENGAHLVRDSLHAFASGPPRSFAGALGAKPHMNLFREGPPRNASHD